MIHHSWKEQTYAGGPLSDVNGDKLAASGVLLTPVYGATEVGAITRSFDMDDSQGFDANVKTSRDWAWFQLSRSTKPRWVPEGDGTFELQFLVCAIQISGNRSN